MKCQLNVTILRGGTLCAKDIIVLLYLTPWILYSQNSNRIKFIKTSDVSFKKFIWYLKRKCCPFLQTSVYKVVQSTDLLCVWYRDKSMLCGSDTPVTLASVGLCPYWKNDNDIKKIMDPIWNEGKIERFQWAQQVLFVTKLGIAQHNRLALIVSRHPNNSLMVYSRCNIGIVKCQNLIRTIG